MNIDRIFYWIFFGIFFLIGKLIRLCFDLIVYGSVRGFHAWRKAHPSAFDLPLAARFEHTHIVGGSGHGKTQLLQQLLLNDIDALEKDRGSIVVIDSQGDLINNIVHLKSMEVLSDKLVIIDPTDIDNPPALNLFDFGLSGRESLTSIEKETLLNSAVSLYEYLFGALLGAELTARQGMLFRYLARLMLAVPNGTIHTLMDFVDDPARTRPYLGSLDPIQRRFFETEFPSSVYEDTRAQILTRLYTVLSNGTLARMLCNEKNMVNIPEVMNKGSLILIHTAKDLLKQEGCEILGRFFLAAICQATQERAMMPADRRRATFVYVDEAHDYFDQALGEFLNQARKFKVGLILAHHNLHQLSPAPRATVMASTSIKIAGGVSAKDASALAAEMGCEAKELLAMKKRPDATEFMWTIRSVREPSVLVVPFGLMERRPKLAPEEYARLREDNRRRVSLPRPQEALLPAYEGVLGQPEVL